MVGKPVPPAEGLGQVQEKQPPLPGVIQSGRHDGTGGHTRALSPHKHLPHELRPTHNTQPGRQDVSPHGMFGRPLGPMPGTIGCPLGPMPGRIGRPLGPIPGAIGCPFGPIPGAIGRPLGLIPGTSGRPFGPIPGAIGCPFGPTPGLTGILDPGFTKLVMKGFGRALGLVGWKGFG